jgi:2-phospho-L-lactate guanylyltransferase
MSCWALVPVKARVEAKWRLSAALSPSQRMRLVAHMLDHVLATLRRAPGVDGVAVTGPERIARGVLWLPDRAGDLNAALADAAASLASRGVTQLLVLHADLPRLTVADVATLLGEGRRQGVALAPDHHGRGTNALFTCLPPKIPFRFGPQSLERHLEEAAWRGVAPALVRRPGLACDVDEPEDLRRLASVRGSQDSSGLATLALQGDRHIAGCA